MIYPYPKRSEIASLRDVSINCFLNTRSIIDDLQKEGVAEAVTIRMNNRDSLTFGQIVHSIYTCCTYLWCIN